MKRFIILLIILVTLPLNIQAQMLAKSTLTDQKVLEYITKAFEDGKSQQEIAKQLLSQGVTTEQLRRVKDKYKKEKNNTTSKTNVTTEDTDTRNTILRRSQESLNKANDEATSILQGMLNEEDIDEEIEEVKTDSIFGHNIFNNANLSFEPNLNIAAPRDYLIGPGDEIVIDIFGATQSSIHQTVNAEGVIVIDQYGPFDIGGLTLAQADNLIRKELSAMYESSTVRVSIGQTRTIMINVMGEVNVPGTYTLSAFSSVFHALYAAGGINELGTLRDVKVFRKGRELCSVDVYDYILNGKLSSDIRLRDNDLVLVGTYENLVTVEGCVKRPMKYEMKRGETVKQVIKYAGSFAADAYTDAVHVKRFNGKFGTAYNVTAHEAGAFQLENGDVISVDKHQDRFVNIAEVRGAAFRPGLFHIGGNVNTIRQIVEAAEGLTEYAVGHHALLYRMNADRTHKMIPVDIIGILNGKTSDIPLESEDILYIPSSEETINKRTVEIQGEVFSPGIYEYSDNETVEDLVLQAGGLLESASLVRVDVARQIRDPKATNDAGDARAEFFTFELQDGLIINYNADFHLEPYDQVYVRRSPSYYDQQNVEVLGQVMYPGLYALTKQNERLSDLILKSGGLKQFGYAKGASLQRHLTSDEQYQLQLQIADAKADLDTIQVRKLQQRLNSTYNVGIDLEKAIANPGSHEDLVLREGDLLLIPQYDNTVKVTGEVFFPNTITFTQGKSARYYIDQAGGYAEEASRRKGYIIYKNGQVARIRKGAKVEPGCEIVIPTKVHRDYTSKVSTYVALASSLATITALIINITK